MKYLGVDFGLKRVGLAVSDGELSSPFKVIEGSNVSDLLEKIRKEAKIFDRVVIGLPEGRMGKQIKKVVKSLKASGLDVVEAEETLSSQNATKLMIKHGIPRKKRAIDDAYSAAIILQDYLDNL